MRRYPDEAIRAAVASYLAGASWDQVEAEHGINRGTVRPRARLLGLDWRRPLIHPQTVFIPDELETRIYLACLLDAEGWIARYPNYRMRWQVGMSNTYEPVMRWLHSFGGRMDHTDRQRELRCYRWRVGRRLDVIHVLEALRPHMRIKHELADLALRESRDFTNHRIAGAGEKTVAR